MADFSKGIVKGGKLKTVVIVEKGMKSGATSLLFHIEMPDGSNVVAETSAALFEMIRAALKGAEIRFFEDKEGK